MSKKLKNQNLIGNELDVVGYEIGLMSDQTQITDEETAKNHWTYIQLIFDVNDLLVVAK